MAIAPTIIFFPNDNRANSGQAFNLFPRAKEQNAWNSQPVFAILTTDGSGTFNPITDIQQIAGLPIGITSQLISPNNYRLTWYIDKTTSAFPTGNIQNSYRVKDSNGSFVGDYTALNFQVTTNPATWLVLGIEINGVAPNFQADKKFSTFMTSQATQLSGSTIVDVPVDNCPIKIKNMSDDGIEKILYSLNSSPSSSIVIEKIA